MYAGGFNFCFADISTQIQDPLVLLDPACLGEALLEWLPVLERILGPEELRSADEGHLTMDGLGEERWENNHPKACSDQPHASSYSPEKPTESAVEENKESPCLNEEEDQSEKHLKSESSAVSNGTPPEPIRVGSPKPLPSDLQADLSQLATLYLELACFGNQVVQRGVRAMGVTLFLRCYFFLLDQERVRRMCLLCYQEQPEVQSSFMDAMLGQKPPLHNVLT